MLTVSTSTFKYIGRSGRPSFLNRLLEKVAQLGEETVLLWGTLRGREFQGEYTLDEVRSALNQITPSH